MTKVLILLTIFIRYSRCRITVRLDEADISLAGDPADYFPDKNAGLTAAADVAMNLERNVQVIKQHILFHEQLFKSVEKVMCNEQTAARLFIDLLLEVGDQMNELNVVKISSAHALLMNGDDFNHFCPLEILAVRSDCYLVTVGLVGHYDLEDPFCYVRNTGCLSLSCLEHDKLLLSLGIILLDFLLEFLAVTARFELANSGS